MKVLHNFNKRTVFGALLTALCLLMNTALAGTATLEKALSPYLDGNQEVQAAISFEAQTLMPYGQDTLVMLNNVLKHLSVNVRLSGENTLMGIAVDGESQFTLEQQDKDGISTLTTALLPNRTLTSPTEAMSSLFLSEGETQPFELGAAVTEAEECYAALTDAISPYAEEKKANFNIEDVGKAKWVRLAKLTAEQSAEMLPQMIRLLGCGMDEAFREQLSALTCKKGFTIALYSAEENGTPLAVYMKGNVSLGEDDSRTLDYLWAFGRGDSKTADTYKLELVKKKAPAESRLIQASNIVTQKDSTFTVTQKSSVTIKNGKDQTVTTEKHSLKGDQGSSKTTLSGTVSTTVKATLDGVTTTETTTYTPDLTLTSAEGSGVLTGKVGYEIADAKKKPTRQMTFTFGEGPAEALTKAAADGSLYAVDEDSGVSISIIGEDGAQTAGGSLTQNAEVTADPNKSGSAADTGNAPLGMTEYTPPASMTTIQLDTAQPEQLTALQEELCQNAAGLLLKALANLPGEDGALLSDNMTEKDYAAFVELLGGL